MSQGSHRLSGKVFDLFPIVAIGVGKGGLGALTKILSSLPSDFPAPILIVMHLPASRKSHLAEILSRRTSRSVQQARSGDYLCPGCVYIAPPNYHLIVTNIDVVWLTVDSKVNDFRPSADTLFYSVARVYKERVIGVVLTGHYPDGAKGIQSIKAAGGRTILQEDPTRNNPENPCSFIDTNGIDLVVPLEDIVCVLNRMVP